MCNITVVFYYKCNNCLKSNKVQKNDSAMNISANHLGNFFSIEHSSTDAGLYECTTLYLYRSRQVTGLHQ